MRSLRMDTVFGTSSPRRPVGNESGPRKDEYAERLQGFFATGCALAAIALAKDVGIINILLKADTPLTTDEIASLGRLKERYCRELLGALVTSRVVEVDKDSRKYSVPAANRKTLLRTAIYSRYLPYFGQKFSAIKSCFKQDGPAGVRYADYPEVLDIMQENRIFAQDTLLDNFVLPAVSGLPERLEKGLEAAELGCGYGTLANNLARRYPASTFTASDVVDNLLESARSSAKQLGLTNIKYENQDIYHLPESYSNRFDWILIRDVIHDLPYPDRAMRQIFRVLKPGGELSLLEVGITGTLSDNVGNMGACSLYTLSTFICVPESYQQPDSAALGAAWNVNESRALIEGAGFTLVNERHDANNNQHFMDQVQFACSAGRGVYDALHFLLHYINQHLDTPKS